MPRVMNIILYYLFQQPEGRVNVTYYLNEQYVVIVCADSTFDRIHKLKDIFKHNNGIE